MEKRKPTYQLTEIKELVHEGRFRLTLTAKESADMSGITKNGVKETILALEAKHFYKSMTEYSNHTVWHDVYRKSVADKEVYIKLKMTRINGKIVLILSFEER